jgi:hypothetical protein
MRSEWRGSWREALAELLCDRGIIDAVGSRAGPLDFTIGEDVYLVTLVILSFLDMKESYFIHHESVKR